MIVEPDAGWGTRAKILGPIILALAALAFVLICLE
jgi:hypothetical protein